MNIRIGKGGRVHVRSRIIIAGVWQETACGLDNYPLDGSFYAPFRPFAQTTDPVDCKHCLQFTIEEAS